jgi:hypothetical protein
MLENNSKSMSAVVETYLIEETSELIHDNEKLSEWNEYVAQLGLSGQTNIAVSKSPIPFLHMKRGMVEMFGILCPRKIKVEDYSISPIPLEILKLISLSKQEKYFNKIEIWYDDKAPDPICIGHLGYWYEGTYYGDSKQEIKDNQYRTEQDVIDAGGKHPFFMEREKYLIGRWGDMKKTLNELKEEARKRYVEETTVECKRQILKAQRELEDLEVEAMSKFN